MYTMQKSLQSLEVGFAFQHNQFHFPFLPCIMPPLRNPRSALSCVGYAYVAKPCTLNESFILPRRTVHVKTDRAARGDFFVGKHSANYQSVTEQHPPARFQHAKHLNQHFGPPCKMAQNV